MVTDGVKEKTPAKSKYLILLSLSIIIIAMALISIHSKNQHFLLAWDAFVFSGLVSIINGFLFYKLRILRDINGTSFLFFLIASF